MDYQPKQGKVVYLSVVKHDSNTDKVNLVRANQVVTNGQSGWQTFEVPEAEQIRVERGWKIGFHYPKINDSEAVIPTTSDGDNIASGFALHLTHSNVISLKEIGVKTQFDALIIKLGFPFQTPALIATIE